MIFPLVCTIIVGQTAPAAKQTETAPAVIVVTGHQGAPEYAKQFNEWAGRWEKAAKQAGAELTGIGTQPNNENETDVQRLEQVLDKIAAKSEFPLWLVLIGHGTYDGKDAKFNLRGPDFSAAQLSKWLARFERPVIVINCASSSGPFINHLKGPRRIIVTATKSGYERSFARLGDALSSAIGDPLADLDKDGQTSLLEAFLKASKRTGEFYEQSSRLATEHALLDDNGDGMGTPATFFRGVRAVKAAKDGASVDGEAASKIHLVLSAEEKKLTPKQRALRAKLEAQIQELRRQKNELTQEEYYARLEKLMLPLAQMYHP